MTSDPTNQVLYCQRCPVVVVVRADVHPPACPVCATRCWSTTRPPSVPLVWTAYDRRFLRALRIAA